MRKGTFFTVQQGVQWGFNSPGTPGKSKGLCYLGNSSLPGAVGPLGGCRAHEKRQSAQQIWYVPEESGIHLLAVWTYSQAKLRTSSSYSKHLTGFWPCQCRVRQEPANTAYTLSISSDLHSPEGNFYSHFTDDNTMDA